MGVGAFGASAGDTGAVVSLVTGAATNDAIPLKVAVLCEDCKMLTSATNGHCPVCGSTALVNLAKILERKAE